MISRRQWKRRNPGLENSHKLYEEYKEMFMNDIFKLAPLPKAVPRCKESYLNHYDLCCEQEGKTPMRYNDNYACTSVSAPQSDTQTQRDYFIARLNQADRAKAQQLVGVFNLYVDNSPKTYKDLIDAIKGDKYTIDAKIAECLECEDYEGYSGSFFGIIWDGPKADPEGYASASVEKNRQCVAAKDAIMAGDAAGMKAAVEAFEAWMPSSTTTAN